uniref:Phospholipase B1, membrane-associated n=1 Tax=Sphenodon punctatus TaxID=8508 RepID=A0A8D0GNK3_SPHPU
MTPFSLLVPIQACSPSTLARELFKGEGCNGAGSSPNNVLDVLTQYRGLSWSVGGNENISTVTTLANILREFNPSLQGYSTGKGQENTARAFLNQAVAGNRAEHFPSQVRRLVDLMKTDTRINFQEDWKLITLFIGGNDLCKFCSDPIQYSPENFASNIQTALDILHREVPRTFVNLVTVLHIKTLRELYQEKRIYCPRLIMRALCPCVLDYDDSSTEIETLNSFNRRYQERTHHLVESGRYDTREDFTVVVQPFLENVIMPRTQDGLPDSSFFAPDCFHFHQKANSQTARALWNNMVRDRLHALKPADVRVIAALGDSLTSSPRNGGENSGLSATYASFHGSLPFSDILREFNINLTGYSTGTGNASEPNAFLNQAVPGAEAEYDLTPKIQHVECQKCPVFPPFIQRLDFNADWKIITVLIGDNDLCNYCKDIVSGGAGGGEGHGANVGKIMEIACGQSKREEAGVAVGTLMNGLVCLFQNSIRQLLESGRYDTRENFTVVLQPFLQNIKLSLLQDGRPDISFFAPDCLHLSQKSHSQFSRALWNSMLQPLGEKMDSFDFTANITLRCPTLVNIVPLFKQSVVLELLILVPKWMLNSLKKLGLAASKGPHTEKESFCLIFPAFDVWIQEALIWSLASGTYILKKFNPKLFGFSTGTQKETARFNFATRGAKAQDISTQAHELVELMKGSSEINYKEDWKLVTLFIGGNDLCQYCLDKVRTCKLEKSTMMISSGRYAQREDFAAVVQPFFRNTIMPLGSNGTPDLSFFAVDCFHFSARTYAEMAVALWNNMVRYRSTDLCPEEQPGLTLFTERREVSGQVDLQREGIPQPQCSHRERLPHGQHPGNPGDLKKGAPIRPQR